MHRQNELQTNIISPKKINIELLQNEIKISNIIKTIPQYEFYFLPIINHNTETTVIFNQKIPHIMIETQKRDLVPPPVTNIPSTIDNIIEYLKTTVEILLTHHIYTPLTWETIRYDTVNKIPIIVNFQKAIHITKWQNIDTFRETFMEDLEKLYHFTPTV